MWTVLHDHCYQHQALIYSCPICSRSFRHKQGLRSHKKHHTASKKHACCECEKCFYTRIDLYCHRVVNHGLKTQYCCKLCHTYWINADMYLQHMRTHRDENRLYKCVPCNKSFKTRDKFRVHRALHYERKLQGCCQICFKSFTHMRILLAHKCVPADVLVFDRIKQEDVFKKSYNETESDTGIKAVFKCKQCKGTFTTGRRLEFHLFHSQNVTRTMTGNSELTCKYCMKGFKYRCKLKKHKASGSCQLKYGRNHCTKCAKTFENCHRYEMHVAYSRSCGSKCNSKGKKFLCTGCGKHFNTQWHLNRHRGCGCGNPKTCDKCERTFVLDREYNWHIKYSKTCGYQKLSDNKNLKCDTCGFKFAVQKTLDAHIARGNCAKVIYECPVCSSISTSQSKLAKHMISHTKEKNFECVKCNKKFLYKDYLNEHYRQNAECGEGVNFPKRDYEPEKWMCEHCGRVGFKSRADFNRHNSTHTTEAVVCGKCGAEFANTNGLRKHMKNTCLGEKVCTICGKKGFRHRLDFFTHMSGHDPHYKFIKSDSVDSKFVCQKCGKIFSRNSNLCNHMKHVCAQGLSCEICGKENFRNKMEFRKHMFDHDPNYSVEKETDNPVPIDNSNAEPQNLMCPICYKTFNTVFAKNKHVEKDHSGAGRGPQEMGSFPCDICKTVLTSQRHYKDHRRYVHCKKVACELCGKWFAPRVLVLHMRTHTGETPYRCDTCGKQFKTQTNLRYHRTKQTCGQRFPTKQPEVSLYKTDVWAEINN